MQVGRFKTSLRICMLSMNRISILIYLSVQSRRCACLYAMRLPVSQQQTLILHSRQNSWCGGPRVYLVKHKAECIGCLLLFFFTVRDFKVLGGFLHPEKYISVNTRNLPFYMVWLSSSFACLLSLCKDFVRHTVVCTHLIQRMTCAV